MKKKTVNDSQNADALSAKTPDMFQERGAISKAQYDKSFNELIEKMGMQAEMESDDN